MNECQDCGSTEFYVEGGYYFCTECQTQKKDRREEILELRFEGTRVTKQKIARNVVEKIDETAEWTTWEQYNFILIGLVNELIDLGATADLKLTVLQLWTSYLRKAEIAFTSMDRKIVPKLAKNFHKKDSDIIYGKIKALKKKRRKAAGTSSVVSSQASEASSNRELGRRKSLMIRREYEKLESSQASESDVLSLASQSLVSVRTNGSKSSVQKMKYSRHAKIEMKRLTELSKNLPPAQRIKYRMKHVTTKYRTGPHVLTPMKLWAILYLALRIHNQNIHLADMLRYAREGNLSYYRLDHLLPEEITLTDSDVKLLTQSNEITHKGMRRIGAEIAKFLFVDEISCPDLTTLISRYCKDLNLPDKISTYAERLIASSPPGMIFNKEEPMIPNYEGRAMAFIIVVLKVLLGMDDITEYELSRIAEKVNSKSMAQDDPCSRLFSFREWQRFIECRRNILMRKHFPTKFRNDPDGLENPELYVRFIKSALSRRDEKPEISNYKNTIPRDLANAMEKCINMLGEGLAPSEDVVFSPSLTPQYSNLEQMLEHPMYDLPDILRINFNDAQVNYLTKPKKLVKSATEYGMNLKIVKSRLHFLDELAPQFERLKMPTLNEWRESVTVVTKTSAEDDSLCVDSDNEDAQRFELDKLRQSYYDYIHDNEKDIAVEEEETSFGFEEVTNDGKLPVPSSHVPESRSVVKLERSKFYKKYHLELPPCLTSNESESQASPTVPNEQKTFTRCSNGKYVFKEKEKRARNSQGKFVSKHSANARQEPEVCETPQKVVSGSNNETATNLRKKLLSNSFGDSDNLFIPCVDYWMYHCVFSKVKPKNFEIFESELPVSFQWLLNECSDLVEMSTEDLYEQVCLVETHFAHVLRPDESECNSYDSKDNKIKIIMCKRKW